MDSKSVIENITKIRKSKNFSGRKLSLALGKSEQHIFLIEKGRIELKLSDFIKICEILDVSPNYLVYGTQERYSCAKQLENLSERDLLLIKHLIFLMETPTEEL